MPSTKTQDVQLYENELDARRAAQQEREDSADFPVNGHSIEDIEADPTLAEEDDGQIAFVIEHGQKVGLSQLYGRKTPVEIEFKLGSKAIKGGTGTGLIPFSDPDLVLVVPVRAGRVEVDPTYDADGNVKHVAIRPHMKPLRAYDSRTEAGRAVLLGDGASTVSLLVARGRSEGTADDDIRAALLAEIDEALAA